MPLAVLLPGILSQGRTTLRSFSPVRSHPTRAVRPRSRPHLSLTPASPNRLLPPNPDCSGLRGSHPGRSRSGFPSRRCSPASASPPLPGSFEPTSAVRLAQPLDLRVFLHVQIRCTGAAFPPHPCPMLPWAFCSAHTVPEEPDTSEEARDRPAAADSLRRQRREAEPPGADVMPDTERRAPSRGADGDPKGRAASRETLRRRKPRHATTPAGAAARRPGVQSEPRFRTPPPGAPPARANSPPGPEGRTSGGEPSPVQPTSAMKQRGGTAGGAEHVSHVKERLAAPLGEATGVPVPHPAFAGPVPGRQCSRSGFSTIRMGIHLPIPAPNAGVIREAACTP